MFDKFKAGARTLSNYSQLISDPQSISDLKHNKLLRHEMLTDVIVSLKGIDNNDTAAAKEFWSVQVCFLIDYLYSNAELFHQALGLYINPEIPLTKNNLSQIIQHLLRILQSKETEKKKILLQPLITDSNTMTSSEKQLSTENPDIVIQSRDSIEFTRKLVEQGKTVIVMDAANAQRPGAGAYERGTFQEALTRNSDLYWKILADFNNVLHKAVAEKRTTLTYQPDDLEIDIASYQARYFELIVYFIKQSLENPDYFGRPEARKEFMNYADAIYSQMQNSVLEIPYNQSYLKNCKLIRLKNIRKTSDLFSKEGVFSVELEHAISGNCYVAEVAAPDCRKTEGLTDGTCTIDDIRRSNKQTALIISSALTHVILQAKKTNADAIILNAFGCKAFENNPLHVAEIFAKILLDHREILKGKRIYFIDLDASMCAIFGKVFNEKLSSNFSFNTQDINGVKLQLHPGKITTLTAGAVAFAPTPKIAGSYSGSDPEQVIMVTEKKGEKTVFSLRAELIELLQKTLNKKDVSTIHLPLLGAGQRGFNPCDCIQALIEAIETVSQTSPRLKELKVHLHIPENNKFQTVINWLAVDRQPSEKKEIAKYYTLTFPDDARKKNFGGGLFMAQVRTTMYAGWKSWSRISDTLYLGKIPTIIEAEELKRRIPNLKQVISCVEDFELAGEGYFFTPLIQTASHWSKMGIHHHQVMVKDGHADDFPSTEITRALAIILNRMANNEVVYVHCKAGRSRSATLVILALYCEAQKKAAHADLGEIFNFLITVRPETLLTSVEVANIKNIISLINKHPELLQTEKFYYQTNEAITTANLNQHIAKYLASDKGKANIAQLATFKDLKYNAIRNLKDIIWTKQLLSDINQSNDGRWLKWSFQYDHPILNIFREQVIHLIAEQLNVIDQQILNALEQPQAQAGVLNVS